MDTITVGPIDVSAATISAALGVSLPLSIADLVSFLNNHDDIIAFVKDNDIDLTVVGPEDPLASGIVDAFKEYNLNIFVFHRLFGPRPTP